MGTFSAYTETPRPTLPLLSKWENAGDHVESSVFIDPRRGFIVEGRDVDSGMVFAVQVYPPAMGAEGRTKALAYAKKLAGPGATQTYRAD